MDQRHIDHVNKRTLEEIEENNENVQNYHKRKSGDAMFDNAERGFSEKIKDSHLMPERRVFI